MGDVGCDYLPSRSEVGRYLGTLPVPVFLSIHDRQLRLPHHPRLLLFNVQPA